MTVEQVTPALILAAILSIVFEWFPGVSTWWEALSSGKKQGLMALGILLISVGSMFYQCRVHAVCPADPVGTIEQLLLVALLAAAANQSVHMLTRR